MDAQGTELQKLVDFPSLVAYLRDKLGWPFPSDSIDEIADELTFEYAPAELGIAPQYAVHVEEIRQIRPLVDAQPWGAFYVRFESKRLPIVLLRRILRALVPGSRSQEPNLPSWCLETLLFICALGETEDRRISFAHFRQREDRVAELRTFSWDSRETHFHYLQKQLETLRWPADASDVAGWQEQWSQAFIAEHRYTIKTSQALAREMARHAATVRDLTREAYSLEPDTGPLHQLYDNFREVLLHDLTPDAFADMVAQTVAYGLFSAATQGDDLIFERMVELIPQTNPFLKDLLSELTAQGAVVLEDLGIGQLVELLRQVNMDAIVQDFGRQTGSGREDPVVHFYELFLSEYDNAQRVKRGVFYTPDPVVSYIVRSVDYLLRTEFGLEDGLADTSVDLGTGQPLVQVLDPAAGTGTFLAHVIDQIWRTVTAKPGADWNVYVGEHLLPRLNGFELMMAPYAVAHMKLGLKLRQMGYDFSAGERLRIYLTNTLEEPVEVGETLGMAGFLSKESNEAAHVKRRAPIMVVIGNPPYAGHSANKSEWIAGLLRGTNSDGRRVENYFEVDGQPLGERNPKWLNDDYVKFIRFGQWRIEQTGAGILAFITNHGYLDNPTFRGMRQSLMAGFDAIYVLDLHGSTKKKETTPEGGPDENVFDIMPGVAILLAVKRPQTEASEVYHANLWGLRGKKYAQLTEKDLNRTTWEQLSPTSPFYLFVPQDVALRGEYQNAWSLPQVSPVNSVGIVTSRDSFVYDFDKGVLLVRVTDFSDPANSDDLVCARYLRPNDNLSVSKVRELIRKDPQVELAFVRSLYRPFDPRWLFYYDAIIERSRREVMRHFLVGSNLGLIATRQTRDKWDVLATDSIIGHKSLAAYDINTLFPLYLYSTGLTLFDRQEPTDAPGGRRPNLNPDFVAEIVQRLDLRFIPDGRGDLAQTFGPEDIFHYIYAVFYAPTYRSRYAEFLKIDFPRVPLTSDVELFRQLCALGADLVALHLLEDDYAAASWNRRGEVSPLQQPSTTFVERETGTTMGAFGKSVCYNQGPAPGDGRVYLDTSQCQRSSYFEGVSEEVWNFRVGGYQVCRKWLYDRRGKKGQAGRTLTPEDIARYQRVVVVLEETIRLMKEIDLAIEEHGGWPMQ